MMLRLLIILILTAAGIPSAHAQTSFVRGHIFVAVVEPEACEFGGLEWIVEIDPETGASWVFADSDDGLCGVSGLRFTPDGTKLLALNYGHFASGPPDGGWVQAFNPDGTSEIILDASDGLLSPYGSNALAFDAQGDLFLLSGDNLYILRFNGLSGPPTIFADSSDGVSFRGALDFAPSGNLYYGRWSGAMLRFTPEGQVSTFDTIGTRSMAVDRFGNVFSTGSGNLYRFDCEDGTTKRILSAGFRVSSFNKLIPSADAQTVYFAENGTNVYAVDAEVGSASVIANLNNTALGSPVGIALYAPPRAGDIDGDAHVDLLDFALLSNCWNVDESQGFPCACRPADLNRDGDVSWMDWQHFINALTGPISTKNSATSISRLT